MRLRTVTGEMDRRSAIWLIETPCLISSTTCLVDGEPVAALAKLADRRARAEARLVSTARTLRDRVTMVRAPSFKHGGAPVEAGGAILRSFV